MSMPLEDLHREIDRRWPKHLEATRDLLRMPSVSMTGEGIEETAETLCGWLREMGATPRLGRHRHTLRDVRRAASR
jgi:acetylornithine deacetylase/succinyl-diaminopimelate desuccinylase-like protein